MVGFPRISIRPKKKITYDGICFFLGLKKTTNFNRALKLTKMTMLL